MGYFTPVIRQYLGTVAHEAKGRMLDVGCGNKPYRDIFGHVTEYIGIDRPSSVDTNRPDGAKRSQYYDVVGSGDELPFTNELFDTVLCTQVIEHLPDPIKFFYESERVSVPGGKLILTAPLVNPVHEAPYDFFRYTNFGLMELCNRSGWKVNKITPLGGAWLAVGYLLLTTIDQRVQMTSHSVKQKIWRLLGQKSYKFLKKLDKRYSQTDTAVGYLVVAEKPLT